MQQQPVEKDRKTGAQGDHTGRVQEDSELKDLFPRAQDGQSRPLQIEEAVSKFAKASPDVQAATEGA